MIAWFLKQIQGKCILNIKVSNDTGKFNTAGFSNEFFNSMSVAETFQRLRPLKCNAGIYLSTYYVVHRPRYNSGQ